MQNSSALQNAKLGRGAQARGRASLLLAAVAAAALMMPALSGAQRSAARPKADSHTQQKMARKADSARQNTAIPVPPAQMPPTPDTPPAPPKPRWPVNDPPQQASIKWGAQGLSIDAQNSSLQQILNDVATQAGVKIEGMEKDERVFGVYGPGQPRDVLSQLLEGTEYNVLMVGIGERGAPQQIVLSEKPEGGPQPNAPVPQGDMYQPPVAPFEPPQPLPQPPQQQPGTRPNEMPRTPQQILQEMQQRQQQMREEQMRQQQQQQQQ